jgi:hypothetical protein
MIKMVREKKLLKGIRRTVANLEYPEFCGFFSICHFGESIDYEIRNNIKWIEGWSVQCKTPSMDKTCSGMQAIIDHHAYLKTEKGKADMDKEHENGYFKAWAFW